MWRKRYNEPGDIAAIERLMAEGFKNLANQQRIEADPLLSLGLELGATVTPVESTPQPAMIDQPTEPKPPVVSADESLRSDWEQARARRAERLSSKGRTARSASHNNVGLLRTVQPAPEPINTPAEAEEIACDVELCRLAVGLRKSTQLRVWIVFLQHVRDTGKNYITREALSAALVACGVKFDDRLTLTRWLDQGNGEFWHVTPNRIRFIGYEALSLALTAYAHDSDEPAFNDLATTNHPGQKRFMYIPVGGKLSTFEANCYAAWIAAKESPTICRDTLVKLWNRDKSVLRDWERIAGINAVHNYAFFTEAHYSAVPRFEDGGLRDDVTPFTVNRNGEALEIHRAQMSNTYHAPAIKMHDKRGASRRVSRVVRAMLKSDNPTGDDVAQGEAEQSTKPGGLESTGKQYFADHDHAKGSVKYTNNSTKPRYVPLYADDGNSFVWEYTPAGIQQLSTDELLRAVPVTERVYA